MYEIYIGKTIVDHIHGFKTRMNKDFTKSKSGVCKFLIHVFNCSQRNNRQLEEPLYIYNHYIYIMLIPVQSDLRATLLFNKLGYDISNNFSRNMIY